MTATPEEKVSLDKTSGEIAVPDDLVPEPAILEGEIVDKPEPTTVATIRAVVTDVAKHHRTRTAARHGLYVAGGAAVTARRLWDGRTTARYERHMRAAEANGDHEKALEWEVRLAAFRKDRHQRRRELFDLVIKVVSALPKLALSSLISLLAFGVLLAIADRDAHHITQPVFFVAHIVQLALLIISVTWGPVLLAAPWITLAAFYLVGRSHAMTGNGWVAHFEPEPADAGIVVTADTVALALQHLRIAEMKKAFKDGWVPVFRQQPVRDGRGYHAVVDLPLGVTAEMVADLCPVLARNLHRAEIETWPSDAEKAGTGPAGSLDIWIADPGALSKPAPEYPLLHEGTADVFTGVPGGVSPRGDALNIPIVGKNAVAGGQMGQGKALALDTLVPTPSGWTTMGALRDGDQVFDEQGQPCSVVKAWQVRHDRPCYEVVFSDGSVIVADAEHLWHVETRASRVSASASKGPKRRHSPYSNNQQHKRSRAKVLTTEEMAGSVQAPLSNSVNYSVSVAEPLTGEAADLPVEPYTLGAWLGDGTSATGTITCLDPEIIAEIGAEGERTHRLPCSEGGAGLYRVEGLTARLRHLGLLRNKHIPTSYLRASQAQRRALLAGLLDTDGYCDKNGTVQFAVTNERLARDFRHLASTLGYKSRLRSKPARLNGKDCGTAWLVTFTPAEQVFRMQRKLARQVNKVRASATQRYITAIRPIPSVPVRCITVDSPNSLYLVGETCIATHNSNACRVILLGCALDPICEIDAFVFAANGDFDAYQPRLSHYHRGVDDEIAYAAVARLRWLYEEVARREDRLAKLGAKKVTRGLAEKYPDLRPIVSLYSECHELFGHPEVGEEAGELACKTAKRARKTAIVLGFDTQSSRKEAIPPKLVELMSVNVCFYVKTWRSNDGFLGDGAFQAGIRATELRPGRDVGTSVTIGLSDNSFELLKWYFVEVNDDTGFDAAADVIARAMGKLAPGTPAGGVPESAIDVEERDLLDDLDEALGKERVRVADVPALLRELAPDWVPYQTLTGTQLRNQMKPLGVKIPNPGNVPMLDPAEVRRVIGELSTADLDEQ